ncbi:MAG: hypothetical protein IPP17_30025, partial [Bacteroidetes bacterium]|nr:hypothetical protein [Bacteroidota bacterium]
VNNGSTDNCGIDTLILSQTAFTCAEAGNNTVVLTVTDNHGNTAIAWRPLTVIAPAMTATVDADTFFLWLQSEL